MVQGLSLGCLKVIPKFSLSPLEDVPKLSQRCLKVANVVSKAVWEVRGEARGVVMKDQCDLKNWLPGGGSLVGGDGYKSSWER